MITIKLSETEKYKKYQAIKKVGYDVVPENNKYILVDTKIKNADGFIDTVFHSLDEILTCLAGDLLRAGILVKL